MYQSEFAVKVSPKNLGAKSGEESFDSEVRALTTLDHPNVIRCYDFFIEDERLFIVLEYCPYGTLEDRILAGIQKTPEEKIPIAAQIVHAISYCHAKRVAHRDIKATNVLFDIHGRVKVADFGLSRHMEVGETLNLHNGSELYAPPELWKRKDHDPFAGDAWSLGVLLHRLVTYEYPWPTGDRDTVKMAIMSAIYNTGRSDNTGLLKLARQLIREDPLDRITVTALETDPLWRANCSRAPGHGIPRFSSDLKANSKICRSTSATTALALLPHRQRRLSDNHRRLTCDSISPMLSAPIATFAGSILA
jgi:serine/threonine protein kinase